LFSEIDITDEQQKQRLVDTFINSIYIFDDRFIMTFNYKDGTKTVTLEDVQSSDLEALGVPDFIRESTRNRRFSFILERLSPTRNGISK
jgi:hypothetical protein